ncbi:nose resistant to fluoxetine protein 6-like [Brevipalpus obovatus]|uniref:nose resistant to fluoxetine protein 6-like n=1 Tax=Brevipalpus obovatus TaxID=246614 RepID=UPI003D9EB29C
MDRKAIQSLIFWMLIYTKILECVCDELILNNCSNVPLFDHPFKISSYPAYRVFPIDEISLNTLNKENISPKCRETLIHFNLNYSRNKKWTIQYMDASGKILPNILGGNDAFLGSYEQCQQIPIFSYQENDLSFEPKFWRIQAQCNHARIYRRIDLCFPSSCTSSDLITILSSSLNPGLKIVEIKSVENYSLDPFNRLEKVSILLFICLGVFIILGTIIHCFIPEKTGSNDDLTVKNILLCFSIKNNYKLITSKKERNDEISGLDAWRVLSILFVILGHVCMVGINHDPLNKGFIKLFTNSWWFQVVANGTIWTDTFFVLSGFLMAHSTADRYRRANLRASRAESILSKAKIYIFEVLQAASYRYLRLIPTMIWMSFLYILARRIGNGPQSYVISESLYEPTYRDAYKIFTFTINLFDIQLNPISGWIQTWFLGADFNFAIISSVTMILLFSNRPLLGWLLNGLLAFGSIILTGYILFTRNYPPILLFDRFHIEDGYFQEVYTKPWTRISSYCIGIFLHGFWTHYKFSRMNKALGMVAIIVCLTCMFSIIMSGKKWYSNEEVSVIESVINGSFYRPLWSICISFLIFLGSSPSPSHTPTASTSYTLSFQSTLPDHSVDSFPRLEFRILANIAYQAYFWHMIIIHYLIASYPLPSMVDFEVFIVNSIAVVVLTFIMSFLSAFAFEYPFHKLSLLYRNAYGLRCGSTVSSNHISSSDESLSNNHHLPSVDKKHD